MDSLICLEDYEVEGNEEAIESSKFKPDDKDYEELMSFDEYSQLHQSLDQPPGT